MDERTLFERTCYPNRFGLGRNTEPGYGHEYERASTQIAWETWQKARVTPVIPSDGVEQHLSVCGRCGYQAAYVEATPKGAQAGTREAPAPGIEQAARAYVAAERAFVALQDGPGAAHLLREADGRMNAAFDTLCAILDAQGSAGEAPALEVERTTYVEGFLEGWGLDNLSMDVGILALQAWEKRQAAAQGSPARSAPESPRGSNSCPGIVSKDCAGWTCTFNREGICLTCGQKRAPGGRET
jgi:hypothetical protein